MLRIALHQQGLDTTTPAGKADRRSIRRGNWHGSTDRARVRMAPGATLWTPPRLAGCCRFAALTETTAAIHDFEAASPINRRRPQGRLMALKLRPTGLSSGIDQDREDYAVFCGHYFAL